jgi:uncharacterized membrane protein
MANEVLASYLAIAAMAAVTYLCRISGVAIMKHVHTTPRIQRALRALPGSVVIATVLPIAVETGAPAAFGLATGIGVMALTRIEFAALLAGLGAVVLARSLGL